MTEPARVGLTVRVAVIDSISGCYRVRPAQAIAGPEDTIRILNLTGRTITIMLPGRPPENRAHCLSTTITVAELMAQSPFCQGDDGKIWRFAYRVGITGTKLEAQGESSPEIIIDEQP
jgi:hypothetical protein